MFSAAVAPRAEGQREPSVPPAPAGIPASVARQIPRVRTLAGVRVYSSPDRRTTTLVDRFGVTVISAAPDGRATVTINGRVASDPGALGDVMDRLAYTLQAPPAAPVTPVLGDRGALAAALALGALLALAAGLPIVRRLLRRERAREVAAESDARSDRIERTLESVAEDAERVAEAQRFTARLLSERLPDHPAAARPARAPERVVTPR